MKHLLGVKASGAGTMFQSILGSDQGLGLGVAKLRRHEDFGFRWQYLSDE
jgi:hypothetical protein